MTRAQAELEAAGIDHRFVDFPRPRDVEESARRQGIDIHQLLKTLLVRTGDDSYVFAVIPGDRRMSWPKVRAVLGVNRAALPDAGEVEAACGYPPGAVTPLGATARWPTLIDASIEGTVSIGGGGFGTGIHLTADTLTHHLGATVADITDVV